MQEQGLMMDCIYCTMIYPNLNSEECPKCHGKVHCLQPAQMMDEESSQRSILESLKVFFANLDGNIISGNKEGLTEGEINELEEKLYSIIKKLSIYNFNLQRAFIDVYRNINDY